MGPGPHEKRIAELEFALAEANAKLDELRGSEAMYRQLVEATNEVFWVGSPDWQQVHYVSPAYARVWGRSCESLYAAPMSWIDSVHPEDRPSVEAEIELKARGDLSRPFPRYRVVRADGSVRWVLARAFAIHDEAGAVVRIAGLAEDITWLKSIEDQLARERDAAEQIIETAPALVVLLDLDGCVIRYNRLVERVSGRPLDEARGQSWCELFVAPSAREHCQEMLRAVAADSSVRGVVGVLATAGGEEIEVEWHATVLRSPEGERVGVLVVGLDISDRLRAQRELVELTETLELKVAERTEQLAASIADKEALLAELHHRVKNNMQVVSSLLYLQLAGTDDERVRELLAASRARIRALTLVHEHLYQSPTPDFEQVDAEHYFAVLVRDLTQALVVSSEVRVVSELEPDILLPIDAAWPCGLIVNELVTNALRHAFPRGGPGTIRVGLSRVAGGDQLRMEVCDDGVGLGPERLRASGRDSLGLRLVHSLARQLGAELEVEALAPGTRVQLRFALG